jgi:spore germination cell wall hydrolase CwlJ-like protein
VHRPQGPIGFETYDIRERRNALREFGPVVFGGIMLVLAFALAGHYMGQNASAHNAIPGEALDDSVEPVSAIATKGSLLPLGENFDIVNMNVLRKTAVVMPQTVALDGKGDYVNDDPGAAVKIVPASIDLTGKNDEPVVKRLSLTPSKAKIEQSFKLKHGEKQKVIAERRLRLAEENCLARAVYFEARSETELGQLAVAKVILNRVKDPAYPKSICGVVYQGSGSRNSCQFSFACDGLPDDVKQPGAWAHSKYIAQKAIAGDESMRAIGSATNYHADYVNPRWARNMKRLIKIGHHIFYSDT